MYELSCEVAIQRGYWTGDAGDPLSATDHLLYGVDTDAPLPPVDEVATDPESPREEPIGLDAEQEAGIFLNEDTELQEVHSLMDLTLMRMMATGELKCTAKQLFY
jgi:hypothetical protein